MERKRHNQTSTMNTRKLLEPVIFEKGARGREMASKSITNIKKKGSTETADESEQPEMYHEGFVDGKKYLVPDANLRAMADMINFKMRKSESAKMLQLENPNRDEFEWYGNRRDSILAKLDNIGLSDEEEEEKSEEEQEEEEKVEEEQEEVQEEEEEGEQEEEQEEEEKVEEEQEEEERVEEEQEEEEKVEEEQEEEEKVEEEQEEEEKVEEEEEQEEEEKAEEEEIVKVEEEESTEESAEEEIEKEEEVGEEEDEGVESVKEELEEEAESVKEEVEEEAEPESLKEEPKEVVKEIKVEPDEDKDTIFPGKFYDPNVQRFLISGHFRTNRKPIYIIHQYAGPSVFSFKDPQFFSHKSEKDTDIFISGEFYKETILEEDENNQPKRLKTKPRKIFVDSSSRIYEDKFSNTFVGNDVDVTLTGSFIKHTLSTMYTPLVTVSLKKGTKSRPGNSKSATAVYVSRPVVHNIFERRERMPRSKLKTPSGGDRDNQLNKPRSKLRLRKRKKAGYSPYRTDGLELPVLVSQPKVENPFQRRENCDERYSDNTGEIDDCPRPVANSSRRISPEKRKTHRTDEHGRRENPKGRVKRKGFVKQKRLANCTDLENEGVKNPINVEIKIDIKSDEKKSAAKQILHHFF